MNARLARVVCFLLLAGVAGQAAALTRTTYLGTTDYETVYGLAEAPDGTVYVTGVTNSADFPDTQAGAQPAYGGGVSDMFVAHLSADLSTLLAATYIGGSDGDTGYAIAYDTHDNMLYVAGDTYSSDFPATRWGAQPAYAGNGDTVVIGLTPNLRTMRATYLGGSGDDTPESENRATGRQMSLAVSSYDRIYVSGPTTSSDFPYTAGGAEPSYGGGANDSYVVELSHTLRNVYQATYLGGSGSDTSYALATDGPEGIVVAGGTSSPDFPVTRGAFQEELQGPSDSFVAELALNLKWIARSTYFGGSGNETGRALYLDLAAGIVYLAGATSSHDLPSVAEGAQPGYGGGANDDFVAALNDDLSAVSICTYLGGSGGENRPALFQSPVSGALYVVGITSSEDFPATAGGTQPVYPGGWFESYVSELSSDLTELIQSTYLGGLHDRPGSEDHTGMHQVFVDSFGVYTAGGSNGEVPNTAGAYQETYAGGGRDGLVSVFDPGLTNP